MARLNIMPLKTDAIMGDCDYMSDACFGKYVRLLIRWWRAGAEPLSDRQLKAFSRASGRDLETIKDHLTKGEDGWEQENLCQTFKLQVGKADHARENGRRGGRPRTQKKPDGYAVDNPDRTETETQIKPRKKLSMNHTRLSDDNLVRDAPDGAQRAPDVSRETKPGKGARLPSDWKLTMSLLAWSMAAENDDETGQEKRRAMSRMEVLSEADKFRDYWHAKRGADACKCDWDATWRNWIRRACEQRPPSSASTGPARGYASHADPVAVGRRLIGEAENEDAVPRERTAL